MNITARLANVEARIPKKLYKPFEKLETDDIRLITELDTVELSKVFDGVEIPNIGTPNEPEYNLVLLKQRLKRVRDVK